MDFYEVEGKRLFERFDIPTDHGVLFREDTDLGAIPLPCAVKAQVLSGKRGKAGGIRFADTLEQLKDAVEAISRMTINGKLVEGIYLTDKIAIREEHYLGFTLDRRTKCILMLYTPCGGMDIEELAANSPEKLLRMSMGLCFDPAAVERALAYFGLPKADQKAIRQIADRLFQMFLALDATTVEINPLAKLADGSFTAADAKLVIDDNALYRQGDYTLIPRQRTESGRARQAREAGLAYVELDKDGDLGVIAGGAGIGMTTVDTISYYGGKAFNFLDLGGGVTREKTCAALTLLLNNPQVNGILVNVFGGINNCKTIAEGVEDALRACPDAKAEVVVKSRGFSQEEGWQIYDRLGLGQVRYGTTDDAVKLLMKRLEARA